MTSLIVRRDSHIDILGGGVGVAECDDGDVDVGGFLDGLSVGAWVGDDDQAGLFEGARYVVREVPGGEAAGDGGSAGVGGEFQDGALAVGACADDGDVGGVVDCGDYAGGEDDFFPRRTGVSWWFERGVGETVGMNGWRLLSGVGRWRRGDVECLPGFADVDHVDTVRTGLPEVGLHVDLEILGAEMALGCEQHFDVLGGGIEDWGEV